MQEESTAARALQNVMRLVEVIEHTLVAQYGNRSGNFSVSRRSVGT